MRRRPTPSEARLWAALRGDALGVHFRRQHVVGSFIVDFACLTRKLVIEVDGASHRDPNVAFADARRQAALEALGLQVLRVSAESVERELPAVLAVIRRALGEVRQYRRFTGNVAAGHRPSHLSVNEACQARRAA